MKEEAALGAALLEAQAVAHVGNAGDNAVPDNLSDSFDASLARQF